MDDLLIRTNAVDFHPCNLYRLYVTAELVSRDPPVTDCAIQIQQEVSPAPFQSHDRFAARAGVVGVVEDVLEEECHHLDFGTSVPEAPYAGMGREDRNQAYAVIRVRMSQADKVQRAFSHKGEEIWPVRKL